MHFTASPHETDIIADKTTLAAPENPTLLQQAEYGALLGPDLEAITKALTEATTQFAKRALFGRSTDDDKKGGGKGGSCDKDCLTIKIKWLVWEISCTLKFIIIKLGLGKFVFPSLPTNLTLFSSYSIFLVTADASMCSFF